MSRIEQGLGKAMTTSKPFLDTESVFGVLLCAAGVSVVWNFLLIVLALTGAGSSDIDFACWKTQFIGTVEVGPNDTMSSVRITEEIHHSYSTSHGITSIRTQIADTTIPLSVVRDSYSSDAPVWVPPKTQLVLHKKCSVTNDEAHIGSLFYLKPVPSEWAGRAVLSIGATFMGLGWITIAVLVGSGLKHIWNSCPHGNHEAICNVCIDESRHSD